MLVIGFCTALPAAAGGRADSKPSRGLLERPVATSGPSADQPSEVAYWKAKWAKAHHFATKRLRLLGARERRIVRLLTALRRSGGSGSRSGGTHSRSQPGGVRGAICSTFRSHCSEALRVADCETGGTFDIHATNGQYLGLFQMGSSERAYGAARGFPFAWNAWSQSRNARSYFRGTGSDWSPWSCKP